MKILNFQKKKNLFFVRLTALETTVETKDQQLAELNLKYNRLSEDFKYNLKLIDDRDKELATFDNRFKGLINIRRIFVYLFFCSYRNKKSCQ